MNFEIVEVRQHFDMSGMDSKSYISFLLIPESNTYQLEVDDKSYGHNDFKKTKESKDKKVSCYLNIFDNQFLGGDRKKESNVEEGVLGVHFVLNSKHGDDVSLLYQVYVDSSVYESILSSTRFSLPKGCSFWIEDKDGEHFNDKWEKNQDGRYEKVNILQFHLFNDFDKPQPKN
jgi:hypothetical protein